MKKWRRSSLSVENSALNESCDIICYTFTYVNSLLDKRIRNFADICRSKASRLSLKNFGITYLYFVQWIYRYTSFINLILYNNFHLLPLLFNRSLQQIPMPPSPNRHLLAFFENRYLEEHSTNALHFVCPMHDVLGLGSIIGAGVAGLGVADRPCSGQKLGEQWPYSCLPTTWFPLKSTFVEHQNLLESSGSMGHFLCVLPLWVNGSTQGLFTLGPLTVLHRVGPSSRSSQIWLLKIIVTLSSTMILRN